MLIFYAVSLFYFILAVGLITAHLVRLRRARQHPPTGQFAVAVIVPCKGNDDPHFYNNLNSIINQEYEGTVRFVFVVENETDPAMSFLRPLEQQFEHVQLCVAGPATQCAQKVFNILQGMDCAADVDIFLFADADINPHSTWLREMVAPFQDSAISVVTGYYRRVPVKPYFQPGDYLAGLFTAVFAIFTADDRFQSLWGGSMAWRKATLEQYNLYDYLTFGIVDDMVLMQALRQHRLKRYFVPSCTVKSYCDFSLPDSIEWLTRQFQYLQIYFKGSFLALAISILGCGFVLAGSAFVFIYGLVNNEGLALVGGVSVWILAMLVGWLLYVTIPVNPASVNPTDYSYRLLPWMLVTPLMAVAAMWALLKTILRVKRGLLTMQWRGIKYRVNIKTGQVVEIIR